MNLISLFLLLLWSQQGTSSSAPSVRPADNKGVTLVGVAPDPFVAASPLIVAAVCSDGVVLIALHTAFATEPLLLDPDEQQEDNKKEETSSDDDKNQTSSILGDLPKGYRGPFRIHSIDAFGTGLVTAGWRADGQILAQYCRTVASDELDVFGSPRTGSDYGTSLASEASLWMAHCAVSDKVRFCCMR